MGKRLGRGKKPTEIKQSKKFWASPKVTMRNVSFLIKTFCSNERENECFGSLQPYNGIIKLDNFWRRKFMWNKKFSFFVMCHTSGWENFPRKILALLPDINLWNMDNIIRILHVKRIHAPYKDHIISYSGPHFRTLIFHSWICTHTSTLINLFYFKGYKIIFYHVLKKWRILQRNFPLLSSVVM